MVFNYELYQKMNLFSPYELETKLLRDASGVHSLTFVFGDGSLQNNNIQYIIYIYCIYERNAFSD